MKMEKENEKYKETELQVKISKVEELLKEIKEIRQKEDGTEVKDETETEEVEEAEEEPEEEIEEEEEPEKAEEVVEKEERQIAKTAFRNPWFYFSIIAAIIIMLFVYKSIAPSQIGTGGVIDNKIDDSIADNNIAVPTNNIEKISVSADDDAFLGNENAPVTIIEFSDYQCPFCARFYLNTLPQLKKEYIDTGEVKLVFRDYSLSFHENAQKAAEAAEAARELGGNDAYWKMHDKIFENQEAIAIEDLVKYAKEIGADETRFKELLDSNKYRDEVLGDFSDGQEAGVQGTPTFFINGRILVGAQPFEAFQQIIEEELK